MRAMRPSAGRAGWAHLGWRLLLALSLLLVLAVGIPLSGALVWRLAQATLLLWGGLLVWVSGGNLFEGSRQHRRLWSALAVGAYGALAAPGLWAGTPRLVDALAPVAALTLAAHLGRRDLPAALRDWALVMGLALYGGLGVVAMGSLLGTLGPMAFALAALLPPLVHEVASLLLRRVPPLQRSLLAQGVALLLATSLAVAGLSATLLNRQTQPLWVAIFYAIVGLLVGGALLVGLLTRPLLEAASSAHSTPHKGLSLARALVEGSHGPILISIALYIPLRLLEMT